TLRGGNVSGLFLVVPLSHLYRRLGDDKSEDRPAPPRRTYARSSAGMAVEISRGLFAQYFRRTDPGFAVSGQGKRDQGGRPPRQLLDADQEFHRGARAVPDDGGYALGRVVVRRHSPAGDHRSRAGRPPAPRQSGFAAG